MKPGVFQSKQSQRVGHDLVTEQQQSVYEILSERLETLALNLYFLFF